MVFVWVQGAGVYAGENRRPPPGPTTTQAMPPAGPPARGPVLAYLLLMTRSMALNRIHQRKNRWELVQRWSAQLFPAAVRSPHQAAEDDELALRVRRALDSIPANERQVLEMAYYEGLSQSAIGERLQVPLGTIKTRSRQGLIRLRALLIDFRSEP